MGAGLGFIIAEDAVEKTLGIVKVYAK